GEVERPRVALLGAEERGRGHADPEVIVADEEQPREDEDVLRLEQAVRGKPAVHRLQHRGDLGDDPSDLREREELALLEALLDRAPQRQTLDELHRVEGIDAGRLGVEDADETGSREPLRLETSRLEDRAARGVRE